MTKLLSFLLTLLVAFPAQAGPAVWTSPVANSVPIDNSTSSYKSTSVQGALEELRSRVVWASATRATTAAGTNTLTEADSSLQYYTGTAAGYSIVLPDATTLFLGRKFELINQSSQPVTLKTSGGATLMTISQTSIAFVTLELNGTAAGTWIAWQVFVSSQATGILNYQVTSSTAFTTASTSDVLITGATITPQAGTYAVWYNASVSQATSGANHDCSIFLAGAQVTDSRRNSRGAAANQAMVDSTMTVVTVDGTDTVDVRVHTNTGNFTVNDRTLLLIRLGG